MFNLVNRAKKKNNKGFSLVELIVVVLIIAIIAVALAPQVMKYVGKASVNTDLNNAANLKAAVQTAVADAQAAGETSIDCTITFGNDGSASASAGNLATYVDAITGKDIPKINNKTYASGGWSVVVGSSGSSITVSPSATQLKS